MAKLRMYRFGGERVAFGGEKVASGGEKVASGGELVQKKDYDDAFELRKFKSPRNK